MRLKGVKCVYESENIYKAIITMRRPKPRLLIRRRMWWANCYKWDMYMYRKLNK